MRRQPIADLTLFSISIISSAERVVGRLAANPRAAMTIDPRTMMRPCNSSVVGDPRSLINDFHSIIFAPSGALPHKGRARIVHRVAQSDPQTANSAGVTLSHRSQPCYGPGGGLWRHQPPGRRGLYPNASLGAPHSRPN